MVKHGKKIITAIVAVMLLASLVVSPVLAQPQVHQFSGSVTLDGNPCASSTVQAKVGTTVVGEGVTVTADSNYYMIVPQVDGVPAEGDTVDFYVDGYLGGSNTWNAGGVTTLSLAASSTGVVYHILTVNVVGSGTVTKSPAAAQYAAGTAVTLTATPASGWQFDSWSGDASGTSTSTTVTMNAIKTVTATFEEEEELEGEVSTPEVTVYPNGAEKEAEYTISFDTGEVLQSGQWIEIKFPGDTNLDGLEDYVAGTGVATKISLEGDITKENVSFTKIHPNKADFSVEGQTVTISITTGYTLEESTVTVTFDKGAGIVNPSVSRSDYKVEVSTSKEPAAKKSEEYAIVAPLYPVRIVTLYDSKGNVLKYYPNPSLEDLENAIAVAMDGDVLEFEPGTYDIDGDLDINQEGVTFKSTDGKEETTLDISGSLTISADEVTLEDFTLVGSAATLLTVSGTSAVITNNYFDVDAASAVTAIEVAGAGLECSDNEFSLPDRRDKGIVASEALAKATISGNTFDGSGKSHITAINVAVDLSEGNSLISGNEITGVVTGIALEVSESGKTLTVSDNSIDGAEIGINVADIADAAKVVITRNSIKGCDETCIAIADTDVTNLAIMWNDLLAEEDELALDNNAEEVNARFNWWGTSVKSEIEGVISGDAAFEPFLEGTADSVTAGKFKAAIATDSLDAKDEASVRVSRVEDDDGKVAALISAAKYEANPVTVAPEYSALGYWDVYVELEEDFDTEDVTVKLRFYDAGITEDTVAYFWAEDFWAECSNQGASNGVVWVDVTEDTSPTIEELEATPFALCEVPPPAEVFTCPQCGLTFDSEAELDAHWDERHKPVPPLPPTQQPPIEFPPAQNVTPAWIWAIVIIGAILVIAVVVLIVTTRRVP